MGRRIGSRIRRLLEKRPRREVDEERNRLHYAALQRMCEMPEGREALEELQRMFAEAQPIPADDSARPGPKIRAAMQQDSGRYIEVVRRFNDYFFAAQQEIRYEQGG